MNEVGLRMNVPGFENEREKLDFKEVLAWFGDRVLEINQGLRKTQILRMSDCVRFDFMTFTKKLLL